MMKIIIILILLTEFQSQERYHRKFENKSLSDVLIQISMDYRLNLVLYDSLINKIRLSTEYNTGEPVKNVLKRILDEKGLFYKIKNDELLIYRKYVNINGYIQELNSGELIRYASIMLGNRATISNRYGYFSLDLEDNPDLRDSLIISHLSFKTRKINLRKAGSNLKIEMEPLVFLSDEIDVAAIKSRFQLLNLTAGYNDFDNKEISMLPSVGGEVDILKATQLLPGVSIKQEGINNLYIRGGDFDQNLVLLDGVTVYNPNHAFGFLSVFNLDVVKNVELIKSGYKPYYSGRLSSVLNVNMKDGNAKENKWQGGISLTNLRLSNEGPIKLIGVSGSYLLSFRRTYLDPLIKLAIRGNETSGLGAYFYDLNSKLNINLTEKDKIYYSFYMGRDNLESETEKAYLNWGNVIHHLRWQHIWTKNIFSNFSFIYSNSFSDLKREYSDKVKRPKVFDVSAKIHNEMQINQEAKLYFGMSFTQHDITATPGYQSFENSENIKFIVNEVDLYGNLDVSLSKSIKISSGFNISNFSSVNGSLIEPRISMQYYFNDKSTFIMSYTEMHQYIHLLTQNEVIAPTYIYYPSTNYLKAQRSKQISFGGNFILENFILNDNYELNVEVFYKDMNNLPWFKQSFDSAKPEEIKKSVAMGQGWSYGFELLLKKRYGSLNGFLSYTYSKVFRKYTGINKNRSFSPKYDRPHVFNLIVNYDFSESWKIGSIFVLASGQPITTYDSSYSLGGPGASGNTNVYGYSRLYNERLPPYNRMDISLSHKFNTSYAKWELFLSIYNIYMYPNPIVTSINYNNKIEKVTIGLIPSIGFNIEF